MAQILASVTSATCASDHQCTTGCRAAAGLRNSRYRTAEFRTRRRHPPSKGIPQLGRRAGNWLIASEGEKLLSGFDPLSLRGKRDAATISLLLGCGLRRSEVVGLRVDTIQRREDHWAIVDLVGKGGRVRTVPIPVWVKTAIDRWAESVPVVSGKLFRSIRKCHAAGGELEQIQFLLGHASVQTTERYIGCKQDLSRAVNNRLPFSLR
jgi:integrase